jgi:hypothetical protein
MMSSDDPSQLPTAILLRSRGRDLAQAANAPTEADRLLWLRQAVNTTYELARREARPTPPTKGPEHE